MTLPPPRTIIVFSRGGKFFLSVYYVSKHLCLLKFFNQNKKSQLSITLGKFFIFSNFVIVNRKLKNGYHFNFCLKEKTSCLEMIFIKCKICLCDYQIPLLFVLERFSKQRKWNFEITGNLIERLERPFV